MFNNDNRAKKSLGQHFLHDRNICAAIVDLLDVREGDNIIEIGPGPGALTGLLLQTGAARIVLLEKDSRFAARWGREKDERLSVILIDALTFAWERLNDGEPWKIVGNLPYNVASPLLWDIFSLTTGMSRGVFMVQKEVSQRITASPGSKTYGALSAWTSSFVTTKQHFVVGPRCFSPPPKVDSAVFSATPLPAGQRPQNPPALSACLKMCFQNRRKQLATIMRMHGFCNAEHILEKLAISPQIRPERLDKFDFARLSSVFSQEYLTKNSKDVSMC